MRKGSTTPKTRPATRFSYLKNLSLDEILHAIQYYVPGMVELKPQLRTHWPTKFWLCFEIFPDGRVGCGLKPRRRWHGRPRLPRYYPLDDFYPVTEFLAHELARRIRAEKLRPEKFTQRYKLSSHLVDRIRTGELKPDQAVIPLIHHFYRGRGISARMLSPRALAAFRRESRNLLPDRVPRTSLMFYRALAESVLHFLAQSPPPPRHT